MTTDSLKTLLDRAEADLAEEVQRKTGRVKPTKEDFERRARIVLEKTAERVELANKSWEGRAEIRSEHSGLQWRPDTWDNPYATFRVGAPGEGFHGINSLWRFHVALTAEEKFIFSISDPALGDGAKARPVKVAAEFEPAMDSLLETALRVFLRSRLPSSIRTRLKDATNDER